MVDYMKFFNMTTGRAPGTIRVGNASAGGAEPSFSPVGREALSLAARLHDAGKPGLKLTKLLIEGRCQEADIGRDSRVPDSNGC